MADSTFDRAFSIVVGHEGGYDTTRADPGNWTGGAVGAGELRGTKFGISAAAFPGRDIAGLTLDDAQAIYRAKYWTPLRCDDLPPPLALLVFDAGVNNGPGRAARWLQAAVGTAQDGQIGPATLAAVTAAVAKQGGAPVCSEFMALRMCFMGSLPTWQTFGLGWSRRLAVLPYQSISLEMTNA